MNRPQPDAVPRQSAGADEFMLEVERLSVRFPVRRGVFGRTCGFVDAVRDVSFKLRRGESLGIVGESGSGKTTIARVIAGLQRPTSGTFVLRGKVGMVFQDPLGSLNPRMTVGEILGEIVADAEGQKELLRMVGLSAEALGKYPHEFSGGQRQRICIARALSCKPDLLICDEAVSALDLSIRAQILELLAQLRERLGLALVFISHDLGVVQHISDRVLVLNRGRKIEEGLCGQVLKAPREEYTRLLVDSVPKIGKPLT